MAESFGFLHIHVHVHILCTVVPYHSVCVSRPMDVIWLRPMNGVRSTRPLATEGADAGLGAVLSRLQMDLKAAASSENWLHIRGVSPCPVPPPPSHHSRAVVCLP